MAGIGLGSAAGSASATHSDCPIGETVTVCPYGMGIDECEKDDKTSAYLGDPAGGCKDDLYDSPQWIERGEVGTVEDCCHDGEWYLVFFPDSGLYHPAGIAAWIKWEDLDTGSTCSDPKPC